MNTFVTAKQARSEKDKTSLCRWDNVNVLKQVINGEQDSISVREAEKLSNALRQNAEGKYEVTFGLYSNKDNRDGLCHGIPVETYEQELQPLWEKMQEIAEEYVAYCEDVMRTEVPKRLNSQFNYCMHEIPFLRGMVLEGLLEQGFLKPEEELSDMIGVYMVVD